jgi:hypothetical protein
MSLKADYQRGVRQMAALGRSTITRNKPREHARKAFYRKGKPVRSTKVNLGYNPVWGAFSTGTKKVGNFLLKKGAEARARRDEAKAKEKARIEAQEAKGIYEGKKKLAERLPIVKELRAEGKKISYQQAQQNAKDSRLEQQERIYRVRTKAPKETKEEIERDYASV